ncbi:MAG: zinc-binding dehydrogenase [Deltaproteobacteria bacterium]|nr:zinc-binding dehydrogenase [Deltaproteobacteria bacterium]
MKAAALFSIPNDIRVTDIDRPQIGDSDFLIKVRACALCATDVKVALRGRHFLIDLHGLPFVLGHEIAGEVAEVGRDVKGVSEGDRVAVSPYVPCGNCYACRIGNYRFCEKAPFSWITPGGFTEYIKVPGENAASRVAKMPLDLSFEEAALTEPVACCFNGIAKSRIRMGEDVTILGAGPIGLMLLQLAKVAGAGRVIMIDMDKKRIRYAKEFGADEVIDAGTEDPGECIRELTQGRGSDVVIEAIGSTKTYQQALQLVRGGGTVTFFGGCPGGSTIEIGTDLLHYMELTLVGAQSFGPDVFHKSLKLISTGRIDAKRLITHRYYSLDKVKEAIDISINKEGLKKVVII